MASGSFSLTIDPVTGQASYTLNASGLVNPTMAHIHVGAANATGGAVYWLYDATGANAPGGSFPVTGTLNISMDHLKTMIVEGTYVNIHTPTYAGGEIRGQIMGGKTATTNQDGQAAVEWSSNQPGDVTIWAIADEAVGYGLVRFENRPLFLPSIMR